MHKLNKSSQLKSTASTKESLIKTPSSQSNTVHAGTLLGNKKFVRKRDASTDSLRKNTPETPKSTKNSATTRQMNQTQNQRMTEANLNRVIKTNGYMKLFHSPFQAKVTENMKLFGMQTDRETKNHELSLGIQTPTVKQNLSSTPQTQKICRKPEQKTYQNFRVLSTAKNIKNFPKQLNQPENDAQSLSYPQTLRQTSQKQSHQPNSQMKILQNQLLILEDQNTRLKRQITQLTLEKQSERKNRLIIEQQLRQKSEDIEKINTNFHALVNAVQKQFIQISMEINRNLGVQCGVFEKKMSWEGEFKRERTGIGKGQKMDKFKQASISINEINEIKIDKFISQFLQPACLSIQQSLQSYSKMYAESKLNMTKLQIKQDILLRTQFESKTLKNEIKSLNEKLSFEKQRVSRFKQMYEKIKKLNIDLRNSTTRKSMKISSENLLGDGLKKKCTCEDDISFILSDVSDEEGGRKQSVKKSLKIK